MSAITYGATAAQRSRRSLFSRKRLSSKVSSLCALCLCGYVLVTPARAQTIAWPAEFPPRPLAARSVNFPPYQMQTLPNGLQVMVVLHHEQPAVSMRLLVRAGSAFDPKSKNGLVHLVSSLLDQGTAGTAPKSAEEFNDAIDFIGGAAGAGAGTDLSYLNMVVMKDSFDAGLRMLSDMARQPAFDQAEIDRQRQQLLSSLQVSFDDPGFIADAVFDRLVYGFHPYGLPQTGTPATIASLTRDDMVAFHRRYFVPNNAILAIVGDVAADEAFAAAGRVFGDWERRDVPAQTVAELPAPTRRVVVVNKPDSVQTEVRVGNLGIPRNHPDYMAVNLAIRILGGEGSNRLHQVLRTARALTYSAQANFDTFKDSGDFEAETNTRTSATGEVLRLIVDEFWRLQRDRVNERELADAKAYLTGSFPLTIETPDAIALQVLNVMFYGLPIEQLQNFRDRVNAVTVDDIQRVARLYLKPDRLSVVLVGNAAGFTDQLKGIGFGSFETVDIGNLDLSAVDFKRAGGSGQAGGAGNLIVPQPRAPQYLPPGQQPAASRDEAAKALLDRVIEATGGIEKLRAIRNMTAKQTVSNPGPNGSMDVETVSYIVYPDQFRVETKLPDATLISAFDGKTVWTRDPQGTREAPEAAAEAKSGLKRDVIALLVSVANGSARVRSLQDVRQDGRGAGRVEHMLEVISGDLDPIVLAIDSGSLMVTRETYTAAGRGGPTLVEERFSDYRPVDGVQMPFAAERRVGRFTVKRRVTDIQINTPLDPSLFKRSAS
jgi:zinc protease